MLIRWGQISLLALLALIALFVVGDSRDAVSQESDEPSSGPGAAASLDDIVTATGAVEIAETINIRCEVPGTSTILEIVADGTQVKAGDLIVQLDDSSLQRELAAQQVDVAQARAGLEQAESRVVTLNAAADSNREMLALRLEIAQLELKKYQDAELPLETQRAESRIQLAEEQVAALTERSERLASVVEERPGARDELNAVRVELTEARADRDLARLAVRVLTEFDGPLTTKKLELRVAEARLALEQVEQSSTASRIQAEADLAAAKLALDEAEQRVSRIREAIGKCAIYAPRDGVAHGAVLNYNVRPEGRPSNLPTTGAMVREGSVLLRIFPSEE